MITFLFEIAIGAIQKSCSVWIVDFSENQQWSYCILNCTLPLTEKDVMKNFLSWVSYFQCVQVQKPMRRSNTGPVLAKLAPRLVRQYWTDFTPTLGELTTIERRRPTTGNHYCPNIRAVSLLYGCFWALVDIPHTLLAQYSMPLLSQYSQYAKIIKRIIYFN